jgi:eukaryotic-like serine/threonine-protein kinase
MSDPARWIELQRLYHKALECSPEERSSFLRQVCARDESMGRELESLLLYDRPADGFLDQSAIGVAARELMLDQPGANGEPESDWHPTATDVQAAAEPPHEFDAVPASIGSYRILALLGEGGMGTVYKAEQQNPNRIVALKVIKADVASDQLLRRFEREADALGRLQHPGIAQIHEAGAAESGSGRRPYFAMEFIQGQPLNTYATERKLNVRARLDLMALVCDAVNHAHQRGIIHRDLKPGNILVDQSGQPKILDFGVARVTDADVQVTRQTDMGQMVGTLAYMSPEQVLADPLAVDTRSDVYAIGVILYELLAGKLPYTLNRNLHEAVQTIREQDAAPLSSVSRIYRGDIETIVTKALEKDKERRYSSAAVLAADIRRYLEDQPISAKPPTSLYQLQKLARRHKALVGGVAAVFVVLVAGIIASTVEAERARSAERAAVAANQAATRERDRAVKAESQAVQDRNGAQASEAKALRDRNLALDATKRADREAATAAAVNEFLQHDLLAQASASNQSGRRAPPDPDLKVRTALDRAAARITGKFDKQPEVEAAIRGTIGQAYTDLGQYPEARKQLERALELQRRILGPENPKTIATMNLLGRTVIYQGKYPEAESLASQTLEISRRVLGPENPATLAAMNLLANVDYFQGKYPQAATLYSQVLNIKRRALGPEHSETVAMMNNLATAYTAQGKYAQAEALQIPTVEIQRRVLGPESPATLEGMTLLANIYFFQGKYAEAATLHNRTLEVRRRILGLEHQDTLISMANLGAAYEREGLYAEAEQIDKQTLEIFRRVLGPEHRSTLVTIVNLGEVYEAQGKYGEAEGLFSQALEIRRRVLGPEHPSTLNTISNLGSVYQKQGKYALAETYAAQALAGRRRALGQDHPDTMESAFDLALAYQLQGKFAGGEPLAREAMETEARTRPDDWQRYRAESLLGASLAGQRRYREAEPLLLEGFQGMEERKTRMNMAARYHLDRARDWIAHLYEEWGQPAKAEKWRKE